VTERTARRSNVVLRDARFRRASFCFPVRRAATWLAALLLLAPVSSRAQGPAPRPWLDWHTVETPHFVLHFPTEYRAWSLSLAQRIETVRSQVVDLVGYGPRRRVHIVIDDPINAANGYAFTTLDAPTIVLWPVSPDPRSDIGDYAVWQDLLTAHEFAHVAHLTRPSRNRFQQLLQSISPVPLGPIATRAPRWVMEGYATYIEGRVSGTGRPNSAWRAAILRQFALEGRLRLEDHRREMLRCVAAAIRGRRRLGLAQLPYGRGRDGFQTTEFRPGRTNCNPARSNSSSRAWTPCSILKARSAGVIGTSHNTLTAVLPILACSSLGPSR